MSAFHVSGGPCRMVGEYQILETLGQGLTSKVKKGRNVRTGLLVALKILFLDSDDMRRDVRCKRFHEEVKAMSICNSHRNTVNLLDVLVNAPYPKKDGSIKMVNVLVLEFCVHGELFRLLRLDGNAQPLPSNIIREYFHQLMDGLVYCHGRGVSHRDVKPQNLLIDSEFGLKFRFQRRRATQRSISISSKFNEDINGIADFGFAATERTNMFCGSVVGTHAYTAPEVLENGTMYSGSQADVWSAGVVLFFMVVGHLPMERADSGDWWFRALKMGRHDLFWQSHERQIKFLLPTDAKILITAMLMPDPTRRIKVEQIMTHPYLCHAQLPRDSLYGDIRSEMLIRCEITRAYNYRATSYTTTTAGSAPSSGEDAGVETALTTSTSAVAQAATGGLRRHNVYPFYSETIRSPGDDQDAGPPEMSAEAAVAVTGGFVAYGKPMGVIKAIEHVLHGMGAEIAGVQRDGARTFRTCSKVSAVIPPGSNTGSGGGVGIVANIYRISRKVPTKKDDLDGVGAPDLIVVLRRKGEDYFRYRIVEKRVINRMTTAATSTTATNEGKHGVNGRQHDLILASTSSSGSGGGRRRRSGRQRFLGRTVR